MGIFFKHRGDFRRTKKFLRRKFSFSRLLNEYGKRGVEALSIATPKDTGEASSSWYYNVSKTDTGYMLSWSNSKMAGGVPLVVLLQYGHGTRGGTYVPGQDFINPALLPVINRLSEDLWKEVLNG